MVIDSKITFRRKHRHMLYGVLCLVLISATVTAVGLLPAQIDDAEPTESECYFTLNGGGYNNEESDDLEDLITKINLSTGNKFTITVNKDATVSGHTLENGNEVTLTSSPDKLFTLTISTEENEEKRHFTVANGATLTFENIILDGNDIGGGVEVQVSGKLIMKDGAVIQNCSASDNGGGVFNAGDFTMHNGEISGNKAMGGGGGVYNEGTFTMHNGEISGNKAMSSSFSGCGGGGVHNEGTFTMHNGKISKNTALEGGGVFNNNMFTMHNGEISDNEANSSGGGVQNLYDETLMKPGTFIMEGGLITGNSASQGGGVRSHTEEDFFMKGGTITKNTAVDGGGVYSWGGNFKMSGGKISLNEAENEGGGVYNHDTFTMTGGEISGNKAVSNGGGVYNSSLYKGNTLFTMTGGKIIGNEAEHGGGVYSGPLEESDTLFIMKGGEISDNTAINGGGVYNTGEFIMKGGEISDNEAGSGGGVNNEGTFTMNGGEISDNEARSGGGVYNTGEFTMEDGKISDNEAESTGGGVYNGGSMFTMEDGEIRDNTAGLGGGVFNIHYMFTMTGGEINDNTAEYDGGGVYNDGGTFIMEGGEISGNKAEGYETKGGGVCNTGSNAKFEMKYGEISGNTADFGGGVYIYHYGTFTMSGGKIIGNTAKLGGGVYNGPYTAGNSTFTMSGGEISGNTAELGGGVYNHSSGTVLIAGGEIRNNTATGADGNGSGGGIYTVDFANLTVKPAAGEEVVFSGNKAPTLRMFEIDNEDVPTYNNNIIGKVVLDELFKPILTAPAYNNYDINYPGDTWVVSIYIEPDGGGTVTVTDKSNGKEYSISDKAGWVYLPAVAGSISLSAAAVGGYEFIRFIITGTNEVIIPDNVPITGNISITAEFGLAYFITPEADEGSEISPNEAVKVMQGENKTFTFSAKPEYRITAVYVDGKAISSSDLASGEYTFSNVLSNHTIRVESEADDGSGGETGTGPGNGNGTGPGGGNGTGPGNGNGTGPGSDGGKGDIENGNGNGSVGSGPGSSGSGNGNWSVLSMICAILAILTGMIAVVAGKDRFRTDNKEKRSKTSMTLRIMALVVGVISVVAFFLVEDITLSPAAFSEWTLLMFVLFLAALILAMVSFRFDETDG